MSIKIFHTGDLHIGMKFNSYPDNIKYDLQHARIEVIDRMIENSNELSCNLFVIAGDLFNSITGIDKKTISIVVASLEKFKGESIVIMPGNHDYDNGMIDLWNNFLKTISSRIIFVNEEKEYPLDEYGLNAVIYPAPCRSKHSDKNNIGWMRNVKMDSQMINIGIAHGSLEGLSPDMQMTYYNMSTKELNDIPVDVWLLGHTHLPYPENNLIKKWKIFNPGTPEPDGLDCKHRGSAWVIEVESDKSTLAERIITGKYRFIDKLYEVKSLDDLKNIETELLADTPEKLIARINLIGSVDENIYSSRLDTYKILECKLGHIIIEDENLSLKITSERIDKEFTKGSFPYQLLRGLIEDEHALQKAYDFIKEAQK